jgi:hypothetical protein
LILRPFQDVDARHEMPGTDACAGHDQQPVLGPQFSQFITIGMIASAPRRPSGG